MLEKRDTWRSDCESESLTHHSQPTTPKHSFSERRPSQSGARQDGKSSTSRDLEEGGGGGDEDISDARQFGKPSASD